jgi:hypothetical protein
MRSSFLTGEAGEEPVISYSGSWIGKHVLAGARFCARNRDQVIELAESQIGFPAIGETVPVVGPIEHAAAQKLPTE